MPVDPFQHSSQSLIAPARSAFAVTPDDSVPLPLATRAIYIGRGGDLVGQMVDSGSDVTFENLSAGTVLAVRLRAIRATGTTAEAIIGLA